VNRRDCPLGILLLVPFCAPMQSAATDVACTNAVVIRNHPSFPAGTVEWHVSKTTDPAVDSNELTIVVSANYRIAGKPFGGALVYFDEEKSQINDTLLGEPYSIQLPDDQSSVVVLSFETNGKRIDNTVIFEFAYYSKKVCPDQIDIYELHVSETPSSGDDESAE